ncbi:hypothetical protein KUCAC02_021569 [Chaenocephalus aceratus]|uniref:Uncharacterized protein n=1 Tax=Chaenocephalus aceratus TaxID=36190 RepID=A0ACB9XHW1_CHAAC|nr:hypothetical protein KUCAC02_021569 [Chaenocephalus aceratus]
MESVEKECGALETPLQDISRDETCFPLCYLHNVQQSSYPVWEDFSAKATKLHSQLRTTILAAVAFLDAFQKVADLATNSRGATRDVGSALTRMCMRQHRSIETKITPLHQCSYEGLVTPLQDRIEGRGRRQPINWTKTMPRMTRGSRQESKGSRWIPVKLQKKAEKAGGNLRPQLDSAMQDVSDMYLLMRRRRSRRCAEPCWRRGGLLYFHHPAQPVVPIVDDLTLLTEDPHKLPPASEQVIRDLKGSDYSWSYQTPPSSPSNTGSRKSSMCSILQMPSAGAHRLSSVSSHDSGFVSQDANTHSKPPSPMPSDIASQKSTSSASSEASETCQSVSECNSPTADWAKSCEPSLASTLQRRRESMDR